MTTSRDGDAMRPRTDTSARCEWANGEFLTPYHDDEWGVPVHDDRRHYEFLVLEAAQAGLSWLTVLRRREGYRAAFCGFDPEQVARFGDRQIDKLMEDPGIIRNRAKIESAVTNARAVLQMSETRGSLDEYLWDFVGGATIANGWTESAQIPAKTELSERLSKDLRRLGFRFVGPVVCYSHLQAAGLVNDHLTSCFRWSELRPGGGS
jgi:DNA-3-methyladenine glycosylase I